MPRAWIVSFLVVAAVVAGILYFTRDTGTTSGQTRESTPEQTRDQTLTANDVMKYLEVFPEVDRAQVMTLQSGQQGREPILAAIKPVLATHSLSVEAWDRLWRRVEDVVNAIRAEKENPKRLARIDRILAEKKSAVAAADGELKRQLERDIATIEAERDRTIVKIHPADREVVMRYWDQLDRMAPRIRPK